MWSGYCSTITNATTNSTTTNNDYYYDGKFDVNNNNIDSIHFVAGRKTMQDHKKTTITHISMTNSRGMFYIYKH